jgi:3-hydroxyacyl-[acyl-carrier-protein] dehydratase
MLKDTFYTIENILKVELETTYSIRLNADHEIFVGHFPENPITPGVVQMEIVKELVGTTLNKILKLDTMSNCKFLAILNPNENPLLDVSLTISETEEQKIKVNAVFKTEKIIFLKMSAVYSK